ncbi:F-box domain-containing protein [Favolaschia claudopus]|uniref:F-box domain-containing protein n=1 Tax=Favolaschia claudopus TaxID=2862362 RepID=A0AAW0C221_9AGAR
MASPLLSLPSDLLHVIFVLLPPENLLAVGQTCRVLHEYTANDYLWHEILKTLRLPLDVEPHAVRNQLPGHVLRRIVTRALRVDHNWRRPNPRIRKMTRLDVDHASQMQFLGSQWLLVLRRAAASLSIWRIPNTNVPYCATTIDLSEIGRPLHFSSSLYHRGGKALIALILSTKSGTELLAYSVDLQSQFDDSEAGVFSLHTPSCILRIPEHKFYEVRVCGHIIATGGFIDNLLTPSAYRILFINSDTGVRCLLDPNLDPAELTQLHFRLHRRQLILTAIRDQTTFVVRIYDIPPAIFSKPTGNGTPPSESTTPLETLTTPSVEYASWAGPNPEYHLSARPMHDMSHISSISFQTFRATANYLFHFPVNQHPQRSPSTPSFSCSFRTETAASAEIVCLGDTGQRAVWLERRWSTDEYTLMKAAFSPVDLDSGSKTEPVIVQQLFARHLALPFAFHTCCCLAFEEASCTVALAVHTGEVYIVQF